MRHLVWILTLFVGTSMAQVTGLSGWNLFVDPGHSQTQNMGVNGYSEAEETLQTALHLRQLLLSKTDIDTVWSSRYNDNVDVTLSERTSDANDRGAAWYHSVHSNAGGPQANDVLLLWGAWIDGTPDPPVGGEAMSDIMVELLSDVMRIPQSGWGSTGDCPFYSGWTTYCQNNPTIPYLYVNRNTNMPSELSEQGHHTNPLQNQLDMNTDYTRLMAYSMFWTVLDKFEIERPFPGILTGILTDSETGLRVNGASVTVNGQTYVTDTYESLFNQYSSNPDELHNGFYFFEGLPDSSFEMVIEADGYFPDTLLIESLSADFATFQDVLLIPNTPPMVIASWPMEGEQEFIPWNRPYMNFNRAMDTESLEAAFSIDPPANGVFYFTQGDKRMIFNPIDTLESLTDYTITIAATATDLGGHPLDGNMDGIPGDDWVLHFRTAPLDTFPPVVSQVSPENGAEGVNLPPVVNVVWDEELDPSTISLALLKLERVADGQVVPVTLDHHSVNDQTVMILHPQIELLGDEAYQIHVFPGIRDPLGNQRVNHEYFSFTTSNYEYTTTSIDDFETNALGNWWEIQQSGSNAGIVTELVSRTISTDPVVTTVGSATALRINYGWDTDASSWLIREYLGGGPPRNVHFTDDHLMQAYVFGDGNGNKFRFCVDDNIGNGSGTEVSPWFTIDWMGWKLVSWDMTSQGTGTWIGDGNLDGTLEFDSIQLSYTPGQPSTGTYYIDELRIADETVLALGDNPLNQPLAFALLPNYPNPFNPWTSIPFTLKDRSQVTVNIYNLKGELVESLLSGALDPGYHVTRWNASQAASGLYVLRLEADGQALSRKITVLK
jgi:hypothetical protein